MKADVMLKTEEQKKQLQQFGKQLKGFPFPEWQFLGIQESEKKGFLLKTVLNSFLNFLFSGLTGGLLPIKVAAGTDPVLFTREGLLQHLLKISKDKEQLQFVLTQLLEEDELEEIFNQGIMDDMEKQQKAWQDKMKQADTEQATVVAATEEQKKEREQKEIEKQRAKDELADYLQQNPNWAEQLRELGNLWRESEFYLKLKHLSDVTGMTDVLKTVETGIDFAIKQAVGLPLTIVEVVHANLVKAFGEEQFSGEKFGLKERKADRDPKYK